MIEIPPKLSWLARIRRCWLKQLAQLLMTGLNWSDLSCMGLKESRNLRCFTWQPPLWLCNGIALSVCSP